MRFLTILILVTAKAGLATAMEEEVEHGKHGAIGHREEDLKP